MGKLGYLSPLHLVSNGGNVMEWTENPSQGTISVPNDTPLIFSVHRAHAECGCELHSTVLIIGNYKDNRTVARKPCRIIYHHNEFWIQSLIQQTYFKEKEHIFLNGTELQCGEERKLISGDVISLGLSHRDPQLMDNYIHSVKKAKGTGAQRSVNPNFVYRFTMKLNSGSESDSLEYIGELPDWFNNVIQNPLLFSIVLSYLPLHELKKVRLISKMFLIESSPYFYSKALFAVPQIQSGELWSFVKGNYNDGSFLKDVSELKHVKLDLLFEDCHGSNWNPSELRKGGRPVPSEAKVMKQSQAAEYLKDVGCFISKFAHQFQSFSCQLKNKESVNAIESVLLENGGILQELDVYINCVSQGKTMDHLLSVLKNQPQLPAVKTLTLEMKYMSDYTDSVLKELFRLLPSLQRFQLNVNSSKDRTIYAIMGEDFHPNVEESDGTQPILRFLEQNPQPWTNKLSELAFNYKDGPTRDAATMYSNAIINLPFQNIRYLVLTNVDPLRENVTEILEHFSKTLENLHLGLRNAKVFQQCSIPPFPNLRGLKITLNVYEEREQTEDFFLFVDDNGFQLPYLEYQNHFPKLFSLQFANQRPNEKTKLEKMPLETNRSIRSFTMGGGCQSLRHLLLPRTYRKGSDPELRRWLRNLASIFPNASYPIPEAGAPIEFIRDDWDCHCKPY